MKKQSWGTDITWLQLNDEATLIKSVPCWWKNKHRDQWDRIKSPEADPVKALNWFLAKEQRQYNGADLLCSEFSDPYLMSVHVMQLMSRLFVVIRFKATDVSLSEVGCAPHLKKNSWKNEKYDHRHGIRPAMPPQTCSQSRISSGEEEYHQIIDESEIRQHPHFRGKLMPLEATVRTGHGTTDWFRINKGVQTLVWTKWRMHN